jgi:hypothetical protein
VTKTHWKKLHNPDYLGAYSLDDGSGKFKDLIQTIASVKNETVVGPDGKKEECMVMRFVEPQKPMIVNATNAKTIEKLFKTPYIEEWAGRKIQIGAEKVKAFGDLVEALRVRPFIPKAVTTDTVPPCTDCEKEIKPYDKFSAAQMAAYTYEKYGKSLCSDCATKLKESTAAAAIADPLAGGDPN